MLDSLASILHNWTLDWWNYDYPDYSNLTPSRAAADGQAGKDPCRYEKHSWLTVKLILISIIGTTIAVLGILGNIITVIVLTRPSMRTPNNLYLTFLAIFDTLLLVSAIVLYAVEYIYEYSDSLTLYTIWLQYVKYGFALSHVAQTGSVYITVAVTFERLLAVLYPTKAKVMCTHDRASVAILIVVVFAILFNSTKYFEIEVVYLQNCTGFGAQHLVPSALLNNDLYTTVHSLWLTQFVMVFIPFIVLFAVNTAIVYRVRRSLKKLSWIQRGRKRDQLKEKSKDATRVLIVIVLVFLLCNALGFVVTLLESLYTQKGLMEWCPGFYAFAREAVNFLAIVNSSINFIIYCIFGQDFRQELISISGCKKFAVLLPVSDKFTAEGLMLNSNFHRRPSLFARYVGMIRQSSEARLRVQDGSYKTRKRKVENGKAPNLTNVRGILASLHASANHNGAVTTSAATKRQRGIVITDTAFDDVGRNHSVKDKESECPRDTGELEGAILANGAAVGMYLTPNPWSRNKLGGSRSNFTISERHERSTSSNKRRRCSSDMSPRSTASTNLQSDLNKSTSSFTENEPLAPFLLGVLISTGSTMRQAGIEKAMKQYESSNEDIAWV